MIKKLTLLVLVSFALFMNAKAQTGFTDDFIAGTISTGWVAGSGQYTLSQSDGLLKIGVNKYEGWKSFVLNLPSAINLTANPFVNIKVKADQDLTLDLYLVDGANVNKNVRKRISRTDGFNMVSWDFTGLAGINLANITKMYFAVNGTALTFSGSLQFDDIKVGSDAQNYSNFSAIPDQKVFLSSKKNRIILQNIENAQTITFTTTPAFIKNISYGTISAGTMIIEYDAVETTPGSESLVLKSTGINGTKDNSVSFQLSVEGNQAPTFTTPASFQCKAAVLQSILLTDVSDGDATARQNLSFELSSDNLEVIGANITVQYTQDAPTAIIHFTAIKAGTANIIVKVIDGQAVNGSTSKSFAVQAFSEWNNVPTINGINPVQIYNNAGEQLIPLTGISDGDGATQPLIIDAVSSDVSIILKPVIDYTSGTTGTLKYTPQPGKTGKVTITVAVNDLGGNVNNNGNKSATVTFTVDVISPPLTGYMVPLTDYAGDRAKKLWTVEGDTVAQTIAYENDGADDVLKISCTSKSTYTGLWYQFIDQKLDLVKNPFITMWVKADKAILFHLYLWDNNNKRNNTSPTVENSIPANTWTKVTYDFTGKMKDDVGNPLAADKISSILFNYHPNFAWPFTAWAGTVWFKDIRIGDKADGTFTQINNCTLNDIPGLALFSDSGSGTVDLSNISSGGIVSASITATSSNTSVVPDPVVSAISNRHATLTYSLAGVTGTAVITVKVTAAGSTDIIKTFTIDVQPVNPAASTAITIDLNTRYQTMRGIGTYVDAGMKSYLKQYTDDLGASVARFGVIGNQIEPQNDNDDPYVLDRSALNYNAFDWDQVKALKAKGVEHFILTIWSVPAWMKKNASEDYFQANALTWEATDNRVDTVMYEEYAEYVTAIILAFKEKAGVDIYGIGLQNEPSFCEPYPSAILSPEKYVKLIKIVGKRFEQEGIQCRLYMGEQVWGQSLYSVLEYLTVLQNDPEAWKYSDVQAVHGYAGDGITAFSANCAQWDGQYNNVQKSPHPKEFWMTETEIPSATWPNIMTNIGAMSTAFSCGNISLWTQWGYTGHYTTLGESNQLTYAESQFAKFVKPGAVRVSATASDDSLLVTSFANTSKYSKNLATVVINKGKTPTSITLTGNNIPATFDVYQTYQLQNFRKTAAGLQKDVSYLLPAQSITTFVSPLPNAAPTIDAIADQVVDNITGEQMVTLTGITDGGEGNQSLTVTPVINSGAANITNVHVVYTSPENTAILYFTPESSKTGNAVIQIEVADNGIVNNKTAANCNIQVLTTTSVKITRAGELKVYPNPSIDYLNISIPDKAYKTAVIINSMGSTIGHYDLNTDFKQVDIRNLKSGLYFILVRGEKGTLTKQFVVKTK